MFDAMPQTRFVIEEKVKQAATACDYLAHRTGLPKGRIKDAMIKGALRWRKQGTRAMKRLRRATAEFKAGDDIAFYYDEALLTLKPPVPQCLSDEGDYSVWYKPDGLMAQGNEFGDHCSLLRQAEVLLEPQAGSRREAYLVHRLDREATGLMIVAHTSDAAARLSDLFARRTIDKCYTVRVSGHFGEPGSVLLLDQPLEGRDAITHVRVSTVDESTSLLDVIIDTGRKHQIRQHLAKAGHPVVGDRRYGGAPAPMLNLTCSGLAFKCPLTGKARDYRLTMEDIEWLDLES